MAVRACDRRGFSALSGLVKHDWSVSGASACPSVDLEICKNGIRSLSVRAFELLSLGRTLLTAIQNVRRRPITRLRSNRLHSEAFPSFYLLVLSDPIYSLECFILYSGSFRLFSFFSVSQETVS